MHCWHLEHGLHLDLTVHGYRVSPCCQFNSTEYFNVDHPSKIHDHNLIKNLKKDFENDIKNLGCNSCWTQEKLTGHSKRLDAPDTKLWKDTQVWDLRPGNLCNLKCIMCMPHLSTKWYEDVDIWTKYNTKFDINQIKNKQSFDWDYVKEHTANKARKIYIAGGEPFYMKEVLDFLEYLSQFSFNCKHTQIMVNTNGISYNEKMINLLKKFKDIVLIVSIDGYAEVDNLIRFPTNFKEKIKFLNTTRSFADIRLNVTVSALNLFDIPNLHNKMSRKFNLQYYKLNHPDFLSINSLKPKTIKKAKKIFAKNENKFVSEMLKEYNYNTMGNKLLKEYLLDLDAKRKTNSVKILSWCFA